MKKGMDIYYKYQRVLNWGQVKASGIQFAFMKVVDGSEVKDHLFQDHVDGAHSVDIEVIPYAFFQPTGDPWDEVDAFIISMKGLGVEKAMLDLEWVKTKLMPEGWNELSEQAAMQKLRAVCSKLEQAGYEIIIYTTTSFIKQYLPNADFLGKYKLFIARYNVPVGEPGELPKHWTTWDYHQYDYQGTVPGIIGNVDMDVQND